MELIDEDAVLARLHDLEENPVKPGMAYFKPLTEAAEEYIHFAEHPEERVYTGIDELDEAMRGTAPGELTLIQGFTHSGKTLLVTELILNNPDVPLIVFTPDETRPLVLTKLAAASTGVSAKDLEWRIQQDDSGARTLLRDVAAKYQRLAVFDDSMTISKMTRMFHEAGEYFGQKPMGCIFDYADLLDDCDDTKQRLTMLKMWGKEVGTAMFVLHQTSRSSGAGGQRVTISSGAYGGEQQSIHVIGVRRKKYLYLEQMNEIEQKLSMASNPSYIKRYEERLDEIRRFDLPRHENTITVNLTKNKRPPCELVDEVDFNLNPITGRVVRGTPPLPRPDGRGDPASGMRAVQEYEQRKLGER